VEAEVTEFLGRARYQRTANAQDARPGARNGSCPTTIKTTAGPVTIDRPKLRGTTERFASRLFGAGVTKTKALESLVIAGFVRGLSVRDVEATLAAEAGLSKSTVSRVCEAIKDQFDRWSARRLDEVELDYLFLDGSCCKLHPLVVSLNLVRERRSLGGVSPPLTTTSKRATCCTSGLTSDGGTPGPPHRPIHSGGPPPEPSQRGRSPG
jgi:putative transposase